MREFLKSLWHPLSLAGLLAWGAIGLELIQGRPETPAWLAAPVPLAIPVALHLLFLALFLWPSKARTMVLGQLAVALTLMLILRAGSLPILLIMVMAQVTHLWPVRSAVLIFGACNLGMYLVYAYVWRFGAPLTMTVMYMSFQAFAAVTSWYAVTAERARDELAAINAELLGTRVLLDAGVRDSERLRISRELHDLLGHHLTALSLNLEVAGHLTEGQAQEHVKQSHSLAKLLLSDVREAVSEMRHGPAIDVLAAIAPLLESVPNLAIELQADPDLRIEDSACAQAIVRCVQELLTNTIKHAGARRLELSLQKLDNLLILKSQDDGQGATPGRLGNGLRGMKERVEAAKGQMRIQTAPGQGFGVTITLPLGACT